MRAIDGDELWEKMHRYSDNEGAKMPYGDDDSLIHKDSACFLIENAPTIDPERKTGRWIDGKCNRCGTHAPFWAMATTYYCSEYCPHCGAHMVTEEEM